VAFRNGNLTLRPHGNFREGDDGNYPYTTPSTIDLDTIHNYRGKKQAGLSKFEQLAVMILPIAEEDCIGPPSFIEGSKSLEFKREYKFRILLRSPNGLYISDAPVVSTPHNLIDEALPDSVYINSAVFDMWKNTNSDKVAPLIVPLESAVLSPLEIMVQTKEQH
jgi:hypothetical protein